MKILWLANIPSPYRVDFFNELGKYCELTVLFERETSTERDGSWKEYSFQNFQGIILKGKPLGVAEAFCPGVVRYLKKDFYDHIFVTNFSDPTGMLAIFTMKAKRIPYNLESDGGFAGTGKGIKELIKKRVLSGAKYYFSTAKEHDQYYLTYGADKNSLRRYPFTSIKEKEILLRPVSPIEKQVLRRNLGMTEKYIILSVGQFIPRKGFDVLLNAALQLPPEVGIYIVGGKPTDDYLCFVKNNALPQVHFLDFMRKTQLAEYYKAADVFVLPTREDIWGLVVNEAFANGLPVITTEHCIAGKEMIEENVNGKIVPVENPVVLARAIMNLINEPLNSADVLHQAHAFTIEKMAETHLHILQQQ